MINNLFFINEISTHKNQTYYQIFYEYKLIKNNWTNYKKMLKEDSIHS